MALDKKEWLRLEEKVNDLRKLVLDTTFWAGSGHIGGGMSALDILTVLYYKVMNFDAAKYDDPNRDRCVVSKGHIGIALAPIFADKGLLEMEQLKTFNKTNSKLGIHLDKNKVKGLDASTGSLGHGSALALGMALATRVNKNKYNVYLILGDGECDEGSVWEAAMATSHYNATNLVTIVDRNRNMIDGCTEDVMKLEPFADKWKAFGFDVKEINGQSIPEIFSALEYAKTAKKPVCIIANTIKGAGIDFMENDYTWHYGAINEEKYGKGKNSLEKYHKARLEKVEKEGK